MISPSRWNSFEENSGRFMSLPPDERTSSPQGTCQDMKVYRFARGPCSGGHDLESRSIVPPADWPYLGSFNPSIECLGYELQWRKEGNRRSEDDGRRYGRGPHCYR